MAQRRADERRGRGRKLSSTCLRRASAIASVNACACADSAQRMTALQSAQRQTHSMSSSVWSSARRSGVSSAWRNAAITALRKACAAAGPSAARPAPAAAGVEWVGKRLRQHVAHQKVHRVGDVGRMAQGRGQVAQRLQARREAGRTLGRCQPRQGGVGGHQRLLASLQHPIDRRMAQPGGKARLQEWRQRLRPGRTGLGTARVGRIVQAPAGACQ